LAQSGHSRGSPPRPLRGPKDVSSAKLQQPRDQLGLRQRFAIGFLTHIGGQPSSGVSVIWPWGPMVSFSARGKHWRGASPGAQR